MKQDHASARRRWRRLAPFFVAACLPFLLLWLPGAQWNPRLVVAAGALTLVIAVIVLAAPSARLSGRAPGLLAFAYLIVVVVLRAAGGPSGVAPMVLLPVFGLALYGTRRQLWCLLVGVALLFIVPVVLVGGSAYPASGWRAGILFVFVATIVGVTVQSLVARVREQARDRMQLVSKLEELAHTDALTGLANRRAWEVELARGLARATRTGEPVSVAVIDIDGLKSINDRQGHRGGDHLLIAVARSWPDVLRPDDLLARIGGDEFALLLPSCTEAEAANVLERLSARTPNPYSCSVGIATWNRAEPADRLMGRADDALYQAKRDGHHAAVAIT